MSTSRSTSDQNEQRLWQAMSEGQVLDLVAGRAGPGGESPAPVDQVVAAQVLAELLVQPPPPGRGVVSRMRLNGARITGPLLLQYAKIDVPVELTNCRFDEPPELGNAVLSAADFTGCRMPEFRADGLRIESDLTLTRLVTGGVSLFRAEVGGNLWLNEARVNAVGTGWGVPPAFTARSFGLAAACTRIRSR
jgi:hypothetical protein